MNGSLPAADHDRATVRPDGSRQDLDQGALAGPVGAPQRMDLARSDRQRGRSDGDDRAVGLRDAGGFEQEAGGGGSHQDDSCGEYAGDAGETGVPNTLAAPA